jgi:hypothetical protein
MVVTAGSIAKRLDWRAIVFRIVAVLVALFFLLLNGGFVAISPWFIPNGPPEEVARMELHRWHSAQWGALMGILFTGSSLALLRRPRMKPLLAQFLVLSTILYVVIFALGIADAHLGDFILLGGMMCIFAASYPAPCALLNFSRQGSFSRPLLALSLLTVALLAPVTWQSLQWQLAGVGGEHAAMKHWLDAVLLAVVLILGAVLAASKWPGWQTLGVIVGIVFTYLGLAALTLPHYDGSWGIVGGALSTLGGMLFVIATRWEARRTT